MMMPPSRTEAESKPKTQASAMTAMWKLRRSMRVRDQWLVRAGTVRLSDDGLGAHAATPLGRFEPIQAWRSKPLLFADAASCSRFRKR